MTTGNERVIATLNSLVETCKDSEQGFRAAADGVQDPQLKDLFLVYALQRADLAHTLQAEIRQLGGEPERGGSVAGSLHRGWMNIRSALAGGDAAILSEGRAWRGCRQGGVRAGAARGPPRQRPGDRPASARADQGSARPRAHATGAAGGLTLGSLSRRPAGESSWAG